MMVNNSFYDWDGMEHLKKTPTLKNKIMTEEMKHATKNKIQINHITSLNHHAEPT